MDFLPSSLQVDDSRRYSVGFAGSWWNAVLRPTVEMDITHPVMGFSSFPDLHSHTLILLPGVTSPANYLPQGLVSYSALGGTQTRTARQALVGMKRNSFQWGILPELRATHEEANRI